MLTWMIFELRTYRSLEQAIFDDRHCLPALAGRVLSPRPPLVPVWTRAAVELEPLPLQMPLLTDGLLAVPVTHQSEKWTMVG
jgi:hypothetical protein